MITRRTFLASTAGGLATLGAGLFVADKVALPSLGIQADGSRIYDYVYGMPKSEAIDFVLENMSADGRFCFGTSEFCLDTNLVPQMPLNVFGGVNAGVDMTLIGEPYDQSLWQAIAAGAYGARAANRECAVFVSPQWFFKGNGAQNLFSGKFDYELYRAFCANTMIPDDLRSQVRQRVEALGVDCALVAAANRDTLLDAINDAQRHEQESVRIRSQLEKLIEGAPKKTAARLAGAETGEPDWEALLTQASQDGAARCTTNNLGVNDAYWKANSAYATERGQNFDEAEDEWSDLKLLLEVIHACGMSCLLILLPMHGAWYDKMGIDEDQRAAWYERARGVANDAGVTYADFHACEYERYFFADTVHPGWRGWVRIEEAFYHFLNNQDDGFLGGIGYGETTGQGNEDMRGVES